MTDLEMWQDHFDRYKIEYSFTYTDDDGTCHLKTEAGDGYTKGYTGFFCEVIFNPDHSFQSFGIWE